MKARHLLRILRGFAILVLLTVSSTNVSSQTITLFPAIDPVADYGYRAGAIECQDSLYFLYLIDNDVNYVAKFDGNSYRLISQPANIEGGPVVLNGSLYYIFSGTKNNIGRVSSNGDITIIPNPDNAYGFTGQPIVYNGKIYCRYINIMGRSSVAIFDGSTVSLIPQPDSGPGFTFAPLVHNGNLYWVYQTITQDYLLGKYNGSNLQLIGDAGTGVGIKSDMAVFNNGIYFNFNDSLGYYDGATISTIALPLSAKAYNHEAPVVCAGKLWFITIRGVQQFQLANYDGNAINLFGTTYPYHFGFYNSIVYKGQVYFRMDSAFIKHSMARIDANDITVMPRFNVNDPGDFASPVIYNNNLYYNYFALGTDSHLAKYDGTTHTLLPHPPTGSGYYNFNQGERPLVYKGSLYFGYSNEQPELHEELARLTDSLLSTQLCAGTNITLTSNLGGNFYQWQLDAGSGYANISDNTYYTGTNTRNLVISNLPSAWYGYKYRCVTAVDYSQVFQLQFTNNWTGAINNLWENPGNWSCGSVPDSNTDVMISFGNVQVNSNVTIRSLQIVLPATLTVSSGYNFVVLL